MDDSQDITNPFAIRRVYVEQLFGRYSYDINLDLVASDFSKLLIIYGDNGSGKTTLLKTIFHLLSPAGDKNHRRFIGRTKFKLLSVELADGSRITAERFEEQLEGTFRMSVELKNRAAVYTLFEFDPISKKILPDKGSRTRSELLKTLRNLNVRLHFLSDDRKIIADWVTTDESEDAESPRDSSGPYYSFVQMKLPNSGEQDSSIVRAVKRVHEWIKNQAIDGSGAGDVTANTLYTDIASHIALSSPQQASPKKPSLSELISEIEIQAERSLSFAQIGLAPEFVVQDLVKVLRSEGAAENAIILNQILKPFLDGVKIKFNALEGLRVRVSTFLTLLNAFYRNKRVTFNVREGLKIKTDRDEDLGLNLLSSGEKQLLLLFCNVLSSSEDSTIFIIDEPELSLNVKWQRQLVNALLDCTSGYKIQFILATHSLELLTQHRESVVRLTPIVL